MISVKEALTIILEQSRSFGTTTININDSTGRVLAEDIYADRDYPPFNRAAMDGFALRSEDFIKGIRTFEIIDTLLAGGTSTHNPTEGQCLRIMTGAATPVEYDCIIRVEDCKIENTRVTFLIEEIKKGHNIALQGEDTKSGKLILSKNTRLQSPQVSALAVVGKENVLVHTLPKIAIISTGDEVIPLGKVVEPHQIRDSNSYALASFLSTYQIPVTYKTLVADNKEALQETIQKIIGYDLIIFSGGVSMGDADFVPEVLSGNGVRNLFHKIKLKPGKPLWFGKTADGGVVFGLPGNPMSCQVCYKLFIEPYLRKCFGLKELLIMQLPLSASKNKNVKLDHYFPCKINGREITPVDINGSGDITSTLYSDGLALHSAETGTLLKGDVVEFIFW